MRPGLATRKHLLGETRIQALLLLREALVGEARFGEILSGEFRVGEILIVVRVREARIGEACLREARVGKALVLIGLALEVLRLVIARSGIRLGLGAAEGRRLKRLIRLAAKVRGLIMGRRVVAGRDALRTLIARRGAGLRALVARSGLGERTRIVQGGRRLRAWVARP